MFNITNYVKDGLKNTLLFKNNSGVSYGGEWTQIYGDTVIDKWYVGDFTSASYVITVEYDSNQKETMQAFVVARPEQASITVFGRTSIEYELINLTATVTTGILSLTATPASDNFAGAKLRFIATYSETMGSLTAPTEVIYTGNAGAGSGGFGGSGGITQTPSFSQLFVSGQDDIVAAGPEDSINLVSGVGITLTTDAEANGITISSALNTFKNILVTGQSTLVASSPTDSVKFTGGAGITLTSNQNTKTITIESTGTFASLGVTTLGVSGNQTIDGTLDVVGATTLGALTVTGNLVVSGTTTSVNSTTLNVSDVNITIGKGATSSAIVDGGGISLEGAYANLIWSHTNQAWSMNRDLIPDVNNTLSLGSTSNRWDDVYANSLHGTIINGSQNNITAVGTLNSLAVSGAISANGGIEATTLETTGLADLLTSRETVIDVTSSATVTYNFVTGAIYYHATPPSTDWTANFNNLPTTDGKIITVNVIVPQGSTAYKITSVTIGGITQTVKWLGSTIPAGNNGSTDIWSFSFLRRGATWTVYAAQSADFG